MRSMFSADGKQWVFGDVFGVTRVDLGKALKVSKHTIKFSNPCGTMSMTQDGKLGMCDGYDGNTHFRATSFGLPALGVKNSIFITGAECMMTTPVGMRVTRPKQGSLEVCELIGDNLKVERALALDAAPDLGALQLGPQRDPATMQGARAPRRRQRAMPDGRYVVLSDLHKLAAGKVGDAAHTDEDWWCAQLVADPMCEVVLEVVGEDVWIAVMDVAADVAHIAHITRAGVITRHALASITPPAFTDKHIITQPISDAICVYDLATGESQSFDVSAHNKHPARSVKSSKCDGPLVPEPKRLPGSLAAGRAHLFFVPWHGEVIVELRSGAALERGLRADMGMFRRQLLEIFAHTNQVVRPLQFYVDMLGMSYSEGYKSAPMWHRLPSAPNTLPYYVAGSLAVEIKTRADAYINGWSWGTFGPFMQELKPTTATLEEVTQTLELMIRADLLPFEMPSTLARIYLGHLIPLQPESPYLERPLLSGAPERLLVRATLEGVKAGGWAVTTPPNAWADEPITADMAIVCLKHLRTWTRYVAPASLPLLCWMMTHHMGADAAPALLQLLINLPQQLQGPTCRSVGECLALLCDRHPELKASSVAAVEALDAAEMGGALNKNTILELLQDSSKSIWSLNLA
jgi:hypothetical protein